MRGVVEMVMGWWLGRESDAIPATVVWTRCSAGTELRAWGTGVELEPGPGMRLVTTLDSFA